MIRKEINKLSSGDKVKYHVPALEKGLDIVEYLSEIAIPQSLADLARALKRSSSEIFRMLDCLEQRGYLLKDESSRYQLSLKLYELAHTHSPIEQLLLVAREPMRDLAIQLRESVHLGTLRDHHLFIVAQEESPEPVRISVEVGRKFPAIKTASGSLLLSHLPDYELQDFFTSDSSYLALNKKQQITFQKKLSNIKKDGYIIESSGITEGVQDISVLIGNPKLGFTATLAIPRLRLKEAKSNGAELLPLVQEKANQITRKLGLSA
jgi:DNA-binding IclR family transcriptional regulator